MKNSNLYSFIFFMIFSSLCHLIDFVINFNPNKMSHLLMVKSWTKQWGCSNADTEVRSSSPASTAIWLNTNYNINNWSLDKQLYKQKCPHIQYQCSWYSPYFSTLIQGENPFILIISKIDIYINRAHQKNPIWENFHFSLPLLWFFRLISENNKWNRAF